MTFAAREESRYLGQPVDLYLFRYGDAPDAFFAYTDAEDAITDSGILYRPIPIMRGAINSSGTLDKAALEIRTPQNVELAELFKLYPPSQVVTLIIRQAHIGDPDGQALVIWTGRVLGCKRVVNEATYTCEPVSTSLKRAILRRHYQYGCPHVLYGPQCKASKAAATATATVKAVAGPVVTFDAGWNGSTPLNKFRNGLMEWLSPNGSREVRSVLRLTLALGEVSVVLGGTALGLSADMEVSIVLGCNHNGDDCEDLHNNILNYGGQPWIPTDNPIGLKNTFY